MYHKEDAEMQFEWLDFNRNAVVQWNGIIHWTPEAQFSFKTVISSDVIKIARSLASTVYVYSFI